MKRCPECRRDYYDDSLLYCLDDGSALLEGPLLAGTNVFSNEPATAIFVSEEAIEAVSTRAPKRAEQTNSIAVLPFRNVSADPENEYFCDGLAEELLISLSKINGLRVAARSSSFSFRNDSASIAEITKALKVSSVLEGSVRKSGDRLRISLQLINGDDGYQIWAEKYDRDMRDIFDLQEEIALSVIDALRVKLALADRSAVVKRETENTEAYKAYLKGRYLRYAKNDHAGAAVAYEEAVRLDPGHAPSWLGLGESYMLRTHYALIRTADAAVHINEAVTKAREIQGETAEALYIEGFFAFIERDWRACDELYARSFALDPDNSRALGTYGVINSVLGRRVEALAYFARSREADPLAAYPYAMTGGGLALMRQPGEAMPFLEQAFEFEKDNSLALWMYCETCVALKRFDEGITMIESTIESSRRPPFLLGILGCAQAAAGRRQEADQILVELRSRPADSPVLVHEACLLGALGDLDAAFATLERATNDLAPMACYVGLPCFDSLRDDPRFAMHIERIGIPNKAL